MDETRLINDIVANHQERMQNLRRFYPFFRLMDLRLTQYKSGQYASVDMGYVVMAVLRFFIEYNHFQDTPVTYEDYENFMRGVLERDFQLKPDEKEDGELIQYIFDKMLNDGRPFIMTCFDPADRTRHVMHVRLIESTLRHMQVVYRVSEDAVAFYLDTKEMQEESRISIAQLLLAKKIRNKDFKGGMQVLDSINIEVVRLLNQQETIRAHLARDPLKGLEELESYHQSLLGWFDSEQQLFASNMALTRQMTAEAGEAPLSEASAQQLAQLDIALKNATLRHSQLMQAYLKMQQAGEAALKNAKRSLFRQSVDLMDLLEQIRKTNHASLLAEVITPLFMPRIGKSMNLSRLDDLLLLKEEAAEEGEKILPMEETAIVDPEKRVQERIAHNFDIFRGVLGEMLSESPQVTLTKLNAQLLKHVSPRVLSNADYYAFLVHLCRKDMHDFAGSGPDKTSPLRFRVISDSNRVVMIPGVGRVTDLLFERMETDGTQES